MKIFSFFAANIKYGGGIVSHLPLCLSSIRRSHVILMAGENNLLLVSFILNLSNRIWSTLPKPLPFNRITVLMYFLGVSVPQCLQWAIIQLIGSPTSDPKIFSWKSVRDHQTCPKIGFRGSRYLKRGPIQGVLDFFKNWKKIHQYLKCGLEPQILGRASSVIPFWKALAIPIAGPYSKLSSQP